MERRPPAQPVEFWLGDRQRQGLDLRQAECQQKRGRRINFKPGLSQPDCGDIRLLSKSHPDTDRFQYYLYANVLSSIDIYPRFSTL